MSATVYLCEHGDTLSDVASNSRLFPSHLNMDERLALIERMNPRVGKYTILSESDLLLTGGENACACKSDFEHFKSKYSLLPANTKRAIEELGMQEAFTVSEALGEFAKRYDGMSALGDSNSLNGGFAAGIAARSDDIRTLMRQIEQTLTQYQNASFKDKPTLKAKAQALHAQLNQRFGTVIKPFVQRASHQHAMHPASSFNRALKLSGGTHFPLTSGVRALKFNNHVKSLGYVARGITVFDLGLRAYNIRSAQNKFEAFFSEAGGFTLSYGVTLALGSYALGLMLTPIGWVIAIILIGAVAVGMDYAGKSIGRAAYRLYR